MYILFKYHAALFPNSSLFRGLLSYFKKFTKGYKNYITFVEYTYSIVDYFFLLTYFSYLV